MRKFTILFILCLFSLCSFSVEKRDILQIEDKMVGLEKKLIKNFSELNFTTYKERSFWNNLPTGLKTQYIQEAEKSLEFNWPSFKETEYLEIIRSGDRCQGVYGIPHEVIVHLVMGELAEGKGRFIDQIVNGVWFCSEQTWWSWSASLTAQKVPNGLPDTDEPVIELGVREIANTFHGHGYCLKMNSTKFTR